jgi:bifunctional non-homologous end joining protein LigD
MSQPDKILPMLATLTDKPFDGENWVFEIKYDGYRIITFIEKGQVRLKTRKNIDYTPKFQLIADALKKWKADAIIDGEIVVLNETGVSNFHALQSYKGGEIYYYVFDLLYYKGKSYLSKPLIERKAMLKKVLPKINFVRYCDHVIGKGKAMFELAEELGLEGLIAKRADSLYRPGVKTKDWLKVKVMKEAVFLIAGLTYSASGVSSIILATAEGGKYHYAGDVGTGFNSTEIKTILATIKTVKNCPLVKEPDYKKPGRWSRKAPVKVIWCRPVLQCEVQYLEITEAGELRHASFKRLIG